MLSTKAEEASPHDNFRPIEDNNYTLDEGLNDFVTEIVDNGMNGLEKSSQSKARNKLVLYGTKNGRFQLLPNEFIIPFLTLASLVTAWYCGNISKGIPPYKVLRSWDVRHIKYGKAQLSQMKKLMGYVEKGTRIVNLPGLLKSKMDERDAINLYNSVKHLFHFPTREKTMRRYATISWKSYYNLLAKRKFRLYGEQERQAEKVVANEVVHQEIIKPVSKRKKLRQRKRTLNEVETDFEKAFPDKEEGCSLGTTCKNKQLKQFMTCYTAGCTRRIHHLCAISENFLDEDNELNCHCSSICMHS